MVAVSLPDSSSGKAPPLPPVASLCVAKRVSYAAAIQQYHITNNGKLTTTHGLSRENPLREGDVVLYLGMVISPASRSKPPSRKWHVIAVLTSDGRKLMISRDDVELVPA